jgi:hypothetical protein
MSKIIPKKINKKTPGTKRAAFFSVDTDTNFVFAKQNLFLYRFVYSSKLSLFVVLLLLASFCVQGAEEVYANTDEVAATEVSDLSEFYDEPANNVQESIFEDEVVSDTNNIVDENIPQDSFETIIEEVISITDDTNTPVPTVAGDNTISTTTDVFNEDEEQIEDGADSGNESEILNTDEDNGTSTVSVINVEESNLEDITESEPAEVELNHETISYTQSDSTFTFNKDECTKLATGSFYCLQPQENVLSDALFSAPDADGDLEIYLVRGGEQVQVTNNKMDDAAPYFDSNTGTIVWHRLIDDRFQIISYDIESGEEFQVTNTANNNMEPTRQGKYTVWQRWVDGGWNIILLEGRNETNLTSSADNNVAPYVHGNLVVWNKHGLNGEKTIEMYDIDSSTYVTVDDPDGMSVSNPRMVFVYDSLHPNGDIITRGYDVMSRKFIELDTLPKELPEELPEAESTGETRALIQSKPSVKSEGVVNGSSTPMSLTPAASTTALTFAATSTLPIEPMTIDMNIPAVQIEATSTPTIENFDIVIEPLIVGEVNSVQE